MKKRIAILASGAGSNARCIIEYFKDSGRADVVLVGCNNPNALVLKKTADLRVASFVFNKNELTSLTVVLNKLLAERVDLIVLAGFLLKVPESLVKAFPKRIINMHPALLPKFGGKGMYGKHVHRAVKNNNDKETGITIHYVNESYDEGAIIFQSRVKIDSADSIEMIALKVHELEYANFPKVIHRLLNKEN